MKKISLLLMLVLTLSMLAGCGADESDKGEGAASAKKEEVKEDFKYDYEALAREVQVTEDMVTFTDGSGEQVSIKKNPERVIGLYNSYIDIWYNCGGDLVGRLDSDTNLPEAFLDVPGVGSFKEPNVELLLELEPDMVFLRYTNQSASIIDILKEHDIDYIALEYNTFEDYLKFVKIFSELNGQPELYEEYGTKVMEDIINVVQQVPKEEEKTVLLIFGTSKSYKTYLSSTSNGQILEQLGAVNIGDSFGEVEDGVTSIDFSMEKVLEMDPDYILVQSMTSIEKVKENLAANLENDPAWQALKAVKNGNYIFLDRDLFHYKPNLEYGTAYKEMAKILYPDQF